MTAASDTGLSSTDNLTKIAAPTFTGTAEAGAKVTLLDGGTPVGNATADIFGNWTITSSTLADGVHNMSAQSTDVAGNIGTASGSLAVTIVTIAPSVSAPDLTAASDTGPSNTDNITNVAAPMFTGTATANSTVELFDGTTLVGSTTATGGTWTINSSVLSDGVHSLTARATDAAGNQATSTALSVTIDSTSPTVSSPDLTAASDSGASSTDNLTKVTTPTFSGTAEAGATVTLLEGTTVLGTATATGGNWTITTSALSDGAHLIVAQANDLAGNQATSNPLTITIDTSAPAAPSVPDLTAASDTGISNSDNVTKNTTPTFSGTAEPGATVTLLEGATTLGSTTADGVGNWTITSTTLSSGVHNVAARATDAAGNVGTTSATLPVTIDTTAPTVSAPDLTTASDIGSSSTDNITNINTPTFSGTAETGSTVELLDGGTVVGSTTIATGTAWTISASLLADGIHSMTARATDAAGNQATSSACL